MGIGASAGGLEALEQFLKPIPRDCGAAFVIVQHLDPNHKGLLTELLQRITPLGVAQITDGMKVEPNHAYVIPPNRDLSILHGVLHLLEPSAPRGLRLPIDVFLRSLALDQQDKALGVILSGMGSDGTLGLRAIKEKAGAVFVQTPVTAKFDGMPRSAIDAGLADVIAPAEELFARIRDFVRHLPPVRAAVEPLEKDAHGLDKIVLLLRAQTGQDFSLYKTNTIQRRIERRMGLHHLAKISDYVRYLRENPQEADLLFKELLIGVTAFFRDPPVWEQLIAETLPALFAAHPGRSALRAWVAGCSTGEEAYSLAMACKEALERVAPAERCALRIFATDLDKDAIDKARAGVYPLNIAADVSEARLRRYFVQEEHGYRIGKEIREMVIFAPQNLVMDPPFTKLDLITCRNLLIYLVPELQKKLIRLFHYGLNPEGVLLLGSSETIGAATALFSALPGKSRSYRRLNPNGRAAQLDFPAVFARPRPGGDEAAGGPARTIPAANLQTLADQVLLQRFSPAAVLVTELGDILYVGGKTGKYLEPAAGKANWNLLAMARDGLNHVLHEGFRRAVRQATAVTLSGVKVDVNGAAQFVNVVIEPLTAPEGLRGTVMVVFTEVPAPPQPYIGDSKLPGKAGNLRIEELTNELRQSHEDLQSVREEMQSSQEELRSANEDRSYAVGDFFACARRGKRVDSTA